MGLSKARVIRIFLFTAVSVFSYAAHAEPQTMSAKGDYVTCWKQPQLKHVLSSDLKYYKVEKFKFFYEQNDVPATVFALHVRGGTEGPFLIGDIRDQIPAIAKRALNTNPVFNDN